MLVGVTSVSSQVMTRSDQFSQAKLIQAVSIIADLEEIIYTNYISVSTYYTANHVKFLTLVLHSTALLHIIIWTILNQVSIKVSCV